MRSRTIKKQAPFSFDSAPLGNAQKLNEFLGDKFRINADGWATMYLLQDATSPSCTALRFARIYASNSEFVLLDGPFIYVFTLEKHRFRDASKGFDCGAARSDVERLICGDPKLRKMDADVNHGFVLMQTKYSKEISYQDPVRMDQIKWVSGVRNKCTTVDCLLKAHSSRIRNLSAFLWVSDSRRRVANDLFNRLTHKNADRFARAGLAANASCSQSTTIQPKRQPVAPTRSSTCTRSNTPGQSLSSTLSRRLARR
ncbi:hypothetical protein [Burkholderia ubonensis]|uniref:hypothetical protein n=1 Tax=Burkholderia ubonensis TaxID=101571 RepID=UPI0007563906|nr:hypothetical protein [Burkholderia ubonensis]KWC54529.1 hypothetical protein WL53_20020 [Burkholderia ubonensis]